MASDLPPSYDTAISPVPEAEDKISPKTLEQTVQFIPGEESGSNDAKVDVIHVVHMQYPVKPQPEYVGLGKDELLLYANDPFWIRLRWILFIAFWILWIALLVGAILIISLSPGCSDTTESSESVSTTLSTILQHGLH